MADPVTGNMVNPAQLNGYLGDCMDRIGECCRGILCKTPNCQVCANRQVMLDSQTHRVNEPTCKEDLQVHPVTDKTWTAEDYIRAARIEQSGLSVNTSYGPMFAYAAQMAAQLAQVAALPEQWRKAAAEDDNGYGAACFDECADELDAILKP